MFVDGQRRQKINLFYDFVFVRVFLVLTEQFSITKLNEIEKEFSCENINQISSFISDLLLLTMNAINEINGNKSTFCADFCRRNYEIKLKVTIHHVLVRSIKII